MAKFNMEEYIRDYIRATDDGMFESNDDLADFVIDQLYDEFGDDVIGIVEMVMAERATEI